jgi:hypothetical protein
MVSIATRPARIVRRRGLGSRTSAVMVAAVVLSLTAGVDAGASLVLISGTRDNLEIELPDAKITDVLSALHERLYIVYRSWVLLDRTVDGRYSEVLSNVISRVLMGYDYVIGRSISGTLSISIIAKSGKAAAADAAAAPVLPREAFVLEPQVHGARTPKKAVSLRRLDTRTAWSTPNCPADAQTFRQSRW